MYYLYGVDWVRGKLFIDELRQRQKGTRSMNFDLSQDWEVFAKTLQTELRSSNLFGGESLIVGKTDKLSKDQTKYLDIFLTNSTTGLLVVWELNQKQSWKPKTKKIIIKEFNELSPAGARNWINDYVKKQEISVSSDFIDMLCGVFGSKVDLMIQELEKYALLHASSVPIGNKPTVADYETGEKNFFEWIRSVLEQDILGIETHAPASEQFMQYLTGLINAVRTVILSRNGLPLGSTNPYWAKKLVRWGSGQTNDGLKNRLSFLLGLDLDIRAGRVNMDRVVDDVKLRLISFR